MQKGARENRQDLQTSPHDNRNDGGVETEVFGPLKAVLESISVYYAQNNVCLNAKSKALLQLMHPQGTAAARAKTERFLRGNRRGEDRHRPDDRKEGVCGRVARRLLLLAKL